MNTQKKLKVQRRYDAWAPVYDSLDSGLGLTSREIKNRKKAVALLMDASGIVVDVGSGSGVLIPWLAKNRGIKVLGLDISRKMLLLSHSRLVNTGMTDNWDLLQADSDNMPIPDSSVDAVISTYGLTSIPDYKRTIKEIQRILKPQGKFVVLDWIKPRNIFARIYFYYLMCITHVMSYTYIERDTITPIKDAGFKMIHEERLDGHMVYLGVFVKK